MQRVRKRRVFYIAGFDPRGVAAYHRLFTEESQKLAARTGGSLRAGSRKREDPLSSTWRAERAVDGGTVETTFEFVHWDDIVRRHWHAGYHQLYVVAAKTYWRWIIESRFLAKLFGVSKWNFITALAPAIVLFTFPPLALLAGWGGYALAQSAAPQASWVAALAGTAGFAAIIGLAWWLEKFFRLGWLLRTFGFVLDYSMGRVPELNERMDRFAERIAAYIEASDDDEIIVVGHSVGANVAVAVLARALAIKPGLFEQYRPVGFLTLGGSIPLQGLTPWSQELQNDLAQLAAVPGLAWVDVTAPQDVASFALVNPLTLCEVTVNGQALQRPLVVPGAFRERLAPENYESASWDVFRMHFQYLMAGERDLPNDYLSVTTDGLMFRDRFTNNRET